MPPDPSSAPAAELNAVLSHPLLLAFGTLLAAWLASRVVHEQVRKMGLERVGADGKLQGFGWTALFSTLTFWAVLVLGLLGIADHIDLNVVETFLQSGFDLLLRAILAAAILAASGLFAASLLADKGAAAADQEQARRERRTIQLVGGVLAVAAATGLSLGTWIFLAMITIPAVLLLKNEKYRQRAANAFADLSAGLRMRDTFRAGSEVGLGEERVRLTGKLGLFRTWVEQGGRKRLFRNESLLALTEAPAPAGDAGAPPQGEDSAEETE